MPPPFLLAIVVEGGLGLAAVGLGALLGYPPAEQIHWTAQAALTGAVATLPLVLAVWVCIRIPLAPFKTILRMLDEAIVPMFKTCRVWQFGVMAAFAGLGEEMLFRGVIQSALSAQWDGPLGLLVGCMVASALFGLLHWVTAAYAVLATLIGLYLGVLWILSGNLLVPAVVHGLYDFWALLYLVRLRQPPSSA